MSAARVDRLIMGALSIVLTWDKPLNEVKFTWQHFSRYRVK